MNQNIPSPEIWSAAVDPASNVVMIGTAYTDYRWLVEQIDTHFISALDYLNAVLTARRMLNWTPTNVSEVFPITDEAIEVAESYLPHREDDTIESRNADARALLTAVVPVLNRYGLGVNQ